MAFDICEHKIRQLAIRAGREIRRVKGLPEEKNVTILFNEVAPLLGLPAIQLNTKKHGDHLPKPYEMKNNNDKFIIPRKDCPQCGTEASMVLGPLCRSCKDAENGKYHSMWHCQQPQCGFKDKLEKSFASILDELGVDWKSGTKSSMGIKTFTDDGLK